MLTQHWIASRKEANELMKKLSKQGYTVHVYPAYLGGYVLEVQMYSLKYTHFVGGDL